MVKIENLLKTFFSEIINSFLFTVNSRIAPKQFKSDKTQDKDKELLAKKRTYNNMRRK
jgi:hypothetical protein